MLSNAHFLEIAKTVASAGTCSRLQVGALLVYARRIISTGYNGAPSGMPHCNHDKSEDLAISNTCEKAVHAEANAVAFAARHGISSEGSTLFVTHSPCLNCARLLINAGVKEVIYEKAYRDSRGVGELGQAGIPVSEYSGQQVLPMSDTSGDGESVHPDEHADSASAGGGFSNTTPSDW